LEIYSFERLPSTQTYLIEQVRSGAIDAPAAILARSQHAGHGSRDNRWESGEGDLLVSVAVPIEVLPEDLPVQSASIYFGWLMRAVLHEAGATDVWLKWPNDLYRDRDKVGGVITQKTDRFFVVGIGVNLAENPAGHRSLSLGVSPEDLVRRLWDRIVIAPSWKQILSEFEVEFQQNRYATTAHDKHRRIRLEEARLCADGSLEINGERIHSLR
jgi:BirA family biotin operon repressor/biotin-[acetyl-CoA-carboxylase] ligase